MKAEFYKTKEIENVIVVALSARLLNRVLQAS